MCVPFGSIGPHASAFATTLKKPGFLRPNGVCLIGECWSFCTFSMLANGVQIGKTYSVVRLDGARFLDYIPTTCSTEGVIARRRVGGAGAAPAFVPRKHGPGTPRVAVRPNYVGLPLAGWTRGG